MRETKAQIIQRWTTMYVDLTAEKKVITESLKPIYEQINEIEELEQVGEYRKPRKTPVSWKKPGLLCQRHDFEVRLQRIDDFLLLFLHPERFHDFSAGVIHRTLFRVALADEDVPISKGPAAVRAFLDSVLAPVEKEIDDEPWIFPAEPAVEPAVVAPAPAPVPVTVPVPTPAPAPAPARAVSPAQLAWADSPSQSGWEASPAQSAWEASPKPSYASDDEDWSVPWPTQEPDTECAGCLELFFMADMIHGNCSHFFCGGCAIHMLQASLKEESMFPPRCCVKELPIELNRSLFNNEILEQYEEMLIKRADKNRTYCSDPKCSKYIHPFDVQNMDAMCGACKKQTCIICKRPAHLGWCAQDREKNLEMLAKELGWQRCNGCGHLVELKSGCNHITCRCGHEYCYKCGAKWKTCECPQMNNWLDDEDGDENVVRQINPVARLQHECLHDRGWHTPPGNSECVGCPRMVVVDLLECTACGLRACGPCRRYRHMDYRPELW